MSNDRTFYAYAVGLIDTTKSPPIVVAVRIYSSEAGDVCVSTPRTFPVDITRSTGESCYADAETWLRDHLARHHAWALALLDAEIP